MAADDDSFVTFVRDQLHALAGLSVRRMFGGYGLYAGERFFGIVHDGRIYFKTDDIARAAYQARGMRPFQPNARQTLANYYELPPDVLEDAGQLLEWARRAVMTANRPARKPAGRRARSRR